MQDQTQVATEKERLIQLLDATRMRMCDVIAKIDVQRQHASLERPVAAPVPALWL